MQLLDGQRVGHLATVDETGQPHAVPVCFVYLTKAIYTAVDDKPKRASPRDLRRVRNILANPRVCLVIDRYDEDWTQLAWLQVRGEARLVEDPRKRRAALAALRAKYPQYRAMDLEVRPLIEISVERVAGWSASQQ
jgi:PPOX class probable F420-dependent enzyme